MNFILERIINVNKWKVTFLSVLLCGILAENLWAEPLPHICSVYKEHGCERPISGRGRLSCKDKLIGTVSIDMSKINYILIDKDGKISKIDSMPKKSEYESLIGSAIWLISGEKTNSGTLFVKSIERAILNTKLYGIDLYGNTWDMNEYPIANGTYSFTNWEYFGEATTRLLCVKENT